MLPAKCKLHPNRIPCQYRCGIFLVTGRSVACHATGNECCVTVSTEITVESSRLMRFPSSLFQSYHVQCNFLQIPHRDLFSDVCDGELILSDCLATGKSHGLRPLRQPSCFNVTALCSTFRKVCKVREREQCQQTQSGSEPTAGPETTHCSARSGDPDLGLIRAHERRVRQRIIDGNRRRLQAAEREKARLDQLEALIEQARRHPKSK